MLGGGGERRSRAVGEKGKRSASCVWLQRVMAALQEGTAPVCVTRGWGGKSIALHAGFSMTYHRKQQHSAGIWGIHFGVMELADVTVTDVYSALVSVLRTEVWLFVYKQTTNAAVNSSRVVVLPCSTVLSLPTAAHSDPGPGQSPPSQPVVQDGLLGHTPTLSSSILQKNKVGWWWRSEVLKPNQAAARVLIWGYTLPWPLNKQWGGEWLIAHTKEAWDKYTW